MKYEWIDEYMLGLPGTEKDHKAEWEATRYMLRGKMYCRVGKGKHEKPIIALKLIPINGDELRRKYRGVIVPGYYMNKLHWNSVYCDGNVPDELLRDMINESHGLILESLSLKAQQEIMDPISSI